MDWSEEGLENFVPYWQNKFNKIGDNIEDAGNTILEGIEGAGDAVYEFLQHHYLMKGYCFMAMER
ncbi:MAG: hypothetical protein CM15mV42_0690 [uncultured marine virus]|nr:MAG: hypothetical protein CM15mV42_0690 [uncultured marine virus]